MISMSPCFAAQFGIRGIEGRDEVLERQVAEQMRRLAEDNPINVPRNFPIADHPVVRPQQIVIVALAAQVALGNNAPVVKDRIQARRRPQKPLEQKHQKRSKPRNNIIHQPRPGY